MDTVASLSDTELGDQIVLWAGRIAAGLARQLQLIAEFDRREAWGGPGLLSCAHWLAWKTGLRPGAAREQVRVARALSELPLLQDAFAAGRMSYSQARAITRVAEPGDETRWVELAQVSTAGQLERLVRGVRRARRVEEDATDPELAQHRMRTRISYDEDGTLVMTVRVPAEDGAVLTAALQQVAAQLDRASAEARQAATVPEQPGLQQPDPGASEAGLSDPGVSDPGVSDPGASDPGVSAETPRATPAQALLHLARAALSDAPPAVARRGRWALRLQVDPLSGWARLADGELLPPTSLEAVRRTLPGRGGTPRLRPVTVADLTRHDAGRTLRLPSLALRELISVLDGERCRFPGCTRVRGLDAHHVVFWRDGGCTDAGNLVLLCGRHHTLVHRDGYALLLYPDRRLTVHTADGVRLLHHPRLPWRSADELDPERQVTAASITPTTVEPRMDLGYAVMVMMQQAA